MRAIQELKAPVPANDVPSIFYMEGSSNFAQNDICPLKPFEMPIYYRITKFNIKLQFLLILIVLSCVIRSSAHANDTLILSCVFKNLQKPLENNMVSIRMWEKDFSRHLYIPDSVNEYAHATTAYNKINDSTLEIKVVPLGNPYYQVFNLLVLNGKTYSVYVDNKLKKQTIYINMAAALPYPATTPVNSKFSFGIELENDCSFPIARDSAGIVEKIYKAAAVFEKLKKTYHKELASDDAFKKYFNLEVLWKAYNLNRRPYSQTAPGKRYNDSLVNAFRVLIKDTPVIFSRPSTLFGSMWLGEGITTKNNTEGLAAQIKYFKNLIPNGLYRDFLIQNFYASTLRLRDINKNIADTLYEYAKIQIEDPYLIWALTNAHQKYINEHQTLPKEILETSILVNEKGGKLTLQQLFDALAATGKKRIVMDFWASWCGPCKQEISESGSFLDSIKKQYPDLTYVYFSIDVPEKYSAAKQFSATHNFSASNHFLVAGNLSPLFKYFAISGIPYHVYLDLTTLKFNANIIGPWNKDVFKEEMEAFSNPKKVIKY